MLFSEKEERARRFALALRAGIPILFLVLLIFYATFNTEEKIILTVKDISLLAATSFIAIYFIYFIMNLSAQETLLDQVTQAYNKKAFIKKLPRYKPTSMACLSIENLTLLSENYSSEQIDNILYIIISKLHQLFKQNGFNHTLIGRGRGSEVLIAVNKKEYDIKTILEIMLKENHSIKQIDVDYAFSVVSNTHNDFQKVILQLRDIITSQSILDDSPTQTSTTKDAQTLSELEKGVIQSIQNKNLHLSFRPLLNAQSDTTDIYEIVVKLLSKKQAYILPRIFLPIVNRLGLGRDYDFSLIKHVIDLLPLVNDNISFTFNLSPFSLRDADFQEKVFDYLMFKRVDPSRLIIQLYERKIHHDLSGYLKTLQKFRVKGMRICIDNFGSSSASMQYMKHFKFDMVQLDRDYVINIEDRTNYAMLQSLIQMSQELNIKTVSKWVDNESQKKRLKVLGIDYMQGFGIGKPIDEETLINKYN